jgi:ABC-type lipoprotein release transport system permease subunit
MKKPLSPFTYFFRNKIKVLAIGVILIVSMITILSPKVIMMSIQKDIEKIVNYRKAFFQIDFNGNFGTRSYREVESKLDNLSSVDYYYKGYFQYVTYNSSFGSIYSYVAFLQERDYIPFMQEMNWEILEGKLPAVNTNEIALTQNLAQNRNVKIGDEVGSSVGSDYLRGRYKVVGILSNGDTIGAIGNLDSVVSDGSNSWSYFVHPKDDYQGQLENQFATIALDYKDQVKISTYQVDKKFFGDEFTMIDTIVNLINSILIVTVSLSLAFLNIILLLQRQQEIGILLALGYTRTRITLKIILENLLMLSLFTVVGFGVVGVIASLVNIYLFAPMAISQVTPFTWEVFWFSLPMPVVTFVSYMLLTLFQMKNLDPIYIIENRNN